MKAFGAEKMFTEKIRSNQLIIGIGHVALYSVDITRSFPVRPNGTPNPQNLFHYGLVRLVGI